MSANATMSNATTPTTSTTAAYSLSSLDMDLLWTYLGSLGVPTILSLVGVFVVMQLYEWKTTKLALRMTDSCFDGEAASSRAAAVLWLCRALLFVLPLGLSITWGYVTATNLDSLFGVTLALGICGLYFLAYGVGRMAAERWRNDGGPSISFLVAGGCLASMMIAFVYGRKPFQFETACLVFFSLDFLVAMKIHFWSLPSIQLKEFVESLKAESVVVKDTEEEAGMGAWCACLGLGEKSTWEEKLTRMKHARPSYQIWGLRLFSFAILFVFAVSSAQLTEHGVYVGYVLALTVAFLELYLALLQWAGLLAVGSPTLLAGFVCRISLLSFGHARWFLGESFLFTVLTCLVGARLVEYLVPLDQAQERRNAILSASEVDLEAVDAAGSKASAADLVKQRPIVSAILIRYLSVLVALVFPFLLLVYAVSQEWIWAPDIEVIDNKQPQYRFGGCAVVFCFCVSLAYASCRYHWRKTCGGGVETSNTVLWLLISGYVICSGIFGFIYYNLSGSNIVLYTGIFVPSATVCAFLFASWCQQAGYLFAIAGEESSKTVLARLESSGPGSETGEGAGTGTGSGDVTVSVGTDDGETSDTATTEEGNSWCSSLCRGGADNPNHAKGQASSLGEEAAAAGEAGEAGWMDYPLTLIVIAYAAIVCSYGIAIGESVSPSYGGFSIGSAMLILPSTSITITRYFSIGAFDNVVIFWNALSSSLVVGYAIVMYSVFLNDTENSWLVLLFLVCLYPALVSAYVAGRKWIEADFIADNYIYAYLGFSALCFLVFIGIVTATVSYVAGIALLCLDIFVTYLVVLCAVAVGNDFFLPAMYRYSLFAFVSIACACGIVAGMLTDAGMTAFSFSWLTFAFLLFLYGVLELAGSDAKKIAFSDQIIPTLALNVSTRTMEYASAGSFCVLIALFLVLFWGVVATLGLPNGYYGVGASCGAFLFAVYFSESTSTNLDVRLANVAEYIDVQLVKSMKARAIEHLDEVFGEQLRESTGGSGGEGRFTPNPNDVEIASGMDDHEKRLKDAYAEIGTSTTISGWREEVEVYHTRQDECNMAFEMEQYYMVHLRLLLCMAGEFIQSSQAKEVERWLASVGLANVSLDEIRVHNQALLGKLKEHMAEVEAEEARRQALMAEARKKKPGGGGIRGSVNLCDTVIPLLSGKDFAKVKDIVQSKVDAFQSLGQAYQDSDFPPYPVLGLHGDWERITDMVPEGKLFAEGGSKSSDPLQGGIGDCWFITGMACVAGDKGDDTVEKAVFVNDPLSGKYIGNLEAGVHCISFYSDYVRYAVVIDDRVPSRYGSPVLCDASHEGALWAPLVEKAHGKFWGSSDGYDQLVSGLPHKAIKCMTNAATVCHSHSSKSEVVVSGKLWQDLLRWHNNDFYIGAGSGGDDDSRKTSGNIVMGHAFSVLDVQSIDNVKLMQLRNPWGETESNLDWSDKSDMWVKHPKIAKKLNHEDKDDGMFWMEYGDYIRYFDITDCCMFTPSESWELIDSNGRGIAQKTASAAATFTFSSVDFTSSKNQTVEGYPQLWITAKRNVTLVIDVEQTQRTDPDAACEIWLQHKKGRKRISKRRQGWRAGCTTSSAGGFNVSLDLPAADNAHVLLLMWNDGQEGATSLPIEMRIRRRKQDDACVTIERASHDAELLG